MRTQFLRTSLRSSRATSAGLWLGASLGVSLLGASGCKWTDFDDLKEDTWVTATGKPDNDAANWGVAIARVDRDGDGGRLAVLGASEAIYNDVVLGPDGDANITSELEIGSTFVLGNLALEPLLLSNPETDEAALVANLADSRITVIRSNAGVLTNIFVMDTGEAAVAATYMVPPPLGDDPPGAQVLVAQDNTVHPAFFFRTMQPNPGLVCELRGDSMEPIKIRALGAYRPVGADFDDLIAFSDSGKLMIYSGNAFNGCTPAATPLPGKKFETGFTGALSGSQIITFEDRDASGAVTAQFALVQAHGDGGASHLGLYRIDDGPIVEVGEPIMLPGLRSAALFQPSPDGKRYVLAGYPAEVVEGIDSGVARAFELDTTTGLAPSAALTLHDAQPQDNQAFGRSVASLPYNGKNIIAIAADNDVFLYFRTALYDETRQGR